MPEVHSIRPLLAVVVSMAAVPLIVASRGRPNLRELWTFAAALVKLGLVLSMVALVLQGGTWVCRVAQVVPGAAIQFRVDPLGMLFAVVASLLWIVTSAYSIGYMRGLKEHGQTRYFCYFALALSATIGVAFAANLLTLYLFYELLSLATYPLVTHHQDQEARTSGRKYLVYILGTSVGLVLPAMVYLYLKTGTLEFSRAGILQTGLESREAVILLFLFVFGFAKAAVMPLHGWLPAAMVAPTPVSALLHAVAVVKVGVFSILRVVTGIFGAGVMAQFHLGEWLGAVAGFTVLTASLIAMSQDELKRRLAFSTVSQLSYILLGVALLTPKGMVGGIVHIAMHAFGKITLFFCAGAIFVATGTKSIREMAGIGRRMPVTMAAFFVGALSVIGLPPAGGFFSKWYLLLGTLEGHAYLLLGVLLASSLLNAVYFLPIVYRAFFCPEEACRFQGPPSEAPLWCTVPLVVTALMSLAVFFFPDPFLHLAERAIGLL